jgi:hypothetical protein
MITYGTPEWENRQRYRTYQWNQLRKRLIRDACKTCQRCRERSYGYAAKANPLQVHHTYYLRDKNHAPWDYPDSCFLVLCKKCHEREHATNSVHYYDAHPHARRIA